MGTLTSEDQYELNNYCDIYDEVLKRNPRMNVGEAASFLQGFSLSRISNQLEVLNTLLEENSWKGDAS